MSNQLSSEFRLFLQGLPVNFAMHQIIEACIEKYGEKYSPSESLIGRYLLGLKYPNLNNKSDDVTLFKTLRK
ncbi:MAG: hypothetical protein QM504_06535 [Pseudomonadota bacterium]